MEYFSRAELNQVSACINCQRLFFLFLPFAPVMDFFFKARLIFNFLPPKLSHSNWPFLTMVSCPFSHKMRKHTSIDNFRSRFSGLFFHTTVIFFKSNITLCFWFSKMCQNISCYIYIDSHALKKLLEKCLLIFFLRRIANGWIVILTIFYLSEHFHFTPLSCFFLCWN